MSREIDLGYESRGALDRVVYFDVAAVPCCHRVLHVAGITIVRFVLMTSRDFRIANRQR